MGGDGVFCRFWTVVLPTDLEKKLETVHEEVKTGLEGEEARKAFTEGFKTNKHHGFGVAPPPKPDEKASEGPINRASEANDCQGANFESTNHNKIGNLHVAGTETAVQYYQVGH